MQIILQRSPERIAAALAQSEPCLIEGIHMDFISARLRSTASILRRAAEFLQRNLIPITQNTALFSLLGTTYGGNGQTTFALPDLRSRAALHAPSSGANYSLGETGVRRTLH